MVTLMKGTQDRLGALPRFVLVPLALGKRLPHATRVELAGADHVAADNGGKPERAAQQLRCFFRGRGRMAGWVNRYHSAAIFPKDYLWGAGTSALQHEGSPFADGAGQSIMYR
jgi:hypothetical protein